MSYTTPKTLNVNTLTFEQYSHVNQWQHNVDCARCSLFDAWIASNLLPLHQVQSDSLARLAVQHQLARLQEPQALTLLTLRDGSLVTKRVARKLAVPNVPWQVLVLEFKPYNIQMKWPMVGLMSKSRAT
jgi:hypothetical protein